MVGVFGVFSACAAGTSSYAAGAGGRTCTASTLAASRCSVAPPATSIDTRTASEPTSTNPSAATLKVCATAPRTNRPRVAPIALVMPYSRRRSMIGETLPRTSAVPRRSVEPSLGALISRRTCSLGAAGGPSSPPQPAKPTAHATAARIIGTRRSIMALRLNAALTCGRSAPRTVRPRATTRRPRSSRRARAPAG